jgi:hypothetical protein
MAEEPRNQWGAPSYNALKRRLPANPAPRSLSTGPFKLGGRWYRQIDNGRANVLVPIDDPTVPPGLRAQQRAAIERAFLMTNSPLAGGAYGVAALAGASPRTRDRAMMAGYAVDAVMHGAAPLGAWSRPGVRPPPTQPPLSTLPRKSAVFGRLTETGQSTGVDARVTRPMINAGKRVKDGLSPPGLQRDVYPYTGSRGHLLAKQLGGEANTLDQVIAIGQNPVNTPKMSGYEGAVKRRVQAGEVVDYFVRPLYNAPGSAPSAILMSARGTRSDFTPALFRNVGRAPRR